MSEIIERLVQNYEGGQISRRDLIVSLSALMTTMAKSSVSAQPSSPAPIKVSTLNHVMLSVSDVGRWVEFYQQVFGMPRQTDQGLEGDWSAATILILAIGDGPQFIAFAPGGDPHINHFCLGMEGFDAERVQGVLAEHGIEAGIRMREEKVPELTFFDPDGIMVQVQDVSYCGGSGVLGERCDVEDRPRGG